MKISIDEEFIEEFVGPFLIVILVLGILSAIFIAISSVNRSSKNAACPIQSKHARVIDKPTVPANTICLELLVTFELDNGERVRLIVSGKSQSQLLLGDAGMLTWQGNALRQFIRDGSPMAHTIVGTTALASSAAAATDWECPSCKRKNLGSATYCASCYQTRHKSCAPAPKPVDTRPAGANEWNCPSCGAVNEKIYTKCKACGAYRY